MNDAEFKAAQATFPWREIRYGNGVIALHDCIGREVPLLTMTAFMVMITEKLKLVPKEENEKPAQA